MSLNSESRMYYDSDLIMNNQNWKKISAILVAVLVFASLTAFTNAAIAQNYGNSPTPSGGNGSPEPSQTQTNSSQGNNSTTPSTNQNSTATSTQNSTQTSTSNSTSSGSIQSGPMMPGGLSANAEMRNKTDVTPKADMEQVRAGEPMLLRYRNMTMLMNCTANCSVVVTADEKVTPKILGLSIDGQENLTVAMNMYGAPLQGEMVMERTLNFYLGIEPNNQEQLRGQIRLYINQTELQQELNREVNALRLTWMFWNTTSAQWQAVPSFIDADGYLVCNTDHFSTWTVSEIEQTTVPAENLFDANMAYIAVGVVVAVIALVAVVTVLKKKK
ncbi:MAG: hypothetical protein ACQCN5_04605 [Candidatus Bathyarchaeia archaeon]|jgi:hypothetical protein